MSSETPAEDTCHICGTPGSETNLGWSEEREDLVCIDCVTHLQTHGHYPDEDGPEREVTTEYEIAGGLGS